MKTTHRRHNAEPCPKGHTTGTRLTVVEDRRDYFCTICGAAWSREFGWPDGFFNGLLPPATP